MQIFKIAVLAVLGMIALVFVLLMLIRICESLAAWRKVRLRRKPRENSCVWSVPGPPHSGHTDVKPATSHATFTDPHADCIQKHPLNNHSASNGGTWPGPSGAARFPVPEFGLAASCDRTNDISSLSHQASERNRASRAGGSKSA